jgi:hypothetical protein
MKLFKLIASRAGQVLFDDRVEADSPREAREQIERGDAYYAGYRDLLARIDAALARLGLGGEAPAAAAEVADEGDDDDV